MEYVILGLLILRSQTIYEINKNFEKNISLFYSASYGSLRTTINNLLKKELIFFEEKTENGRNKKIYIILNEGKEEFFKWMYEDISTSNLETKALTKLFFLGLVEDTEKKKDILKNIINTIELSKNNLETMKNSFDDFAVPNEYKDVFFYQMNSLDYGIQSHLFSKAWFEKVLEDLN